MRLPLLLLNLVGTLAVNKTEHHLARCHGYVPNLNLATLEKALHVDSLEKALHVDSWGDHVQMLQTRAFASEARRHEPAPKPAKPAMPLERRREPAAKPAKPVLPAERIRKQFNMNVSKARNDPETHLAGLLIVSAIIIGLAAFSLYRAYSMGEALKTLDIPKIIMIGFVLLDSILMGGKANGKSVECLSKPRLAVLDVPKFILMGFVMLNGILASNKVEEADLKSVVVGWYVPFIMPAFSLLAGIFGRGVSRNSLCKVVCYTVGSNGFCFVLSAVLYGGGRQLFPAPSAWFLWCLLSWRLLISPSFYFAGRLHIPLAMMFALLHCVFFFLFCCTYPERPELESSYIKQQFRFTYAQFLLNTRFFAIGLLQTPTEWCDTLVDFQKGYLSVFYLSVWFMLDRLSPTWHQNWARFGPRSSIVTMRAFLTYTLEFALVLGFMLSVLNIIVAMSARSVKRLPRLMNAMEGWGTRTLYCYVLHRLFLQVLASLGAISLVEAIPETARLPLLIVVCVGTIVLLCSDGVRYIFNCVMEPYWIVDLAVKSIASRFQQISASGDRQ